jgi:hypothetical protein
MQPLVKMLGKNRIAMQAAGLSGLPTPVTIYDNWSAYDKLSDNIPLTEALAMKELNELLRWKKNKVSVDYYIMDAFWFDKQGAYRTWDKQYWPNGPDQWLNTCKENHIKTGLWFAVNLIASGGERFLEVIPEWKDSLAEGGTTMCLFEGGYLRHYAETLQMWIDKGVQSLMFDFAYFDAATSEAKKIYLPAEIEEMNKRAFFGMLKALKLKNPQVLTLAFNGFGGQMDNTYEPFRKTVDSRWLEVFDTMYCGDPRFADVPAMNIWRSEDIYSDQMVRIFEMNDIPLKRIANCEFMAGKTGTCYYRAKAGWKSNVILDVARGGWANLYYGNLELFSDEEAQWFAQVQKMFHKLQAYGIISSFGAMPGEARPYGYTAKEENGAVITVVNPMQSVATVELPVNIFSKSKIIYAESGFKPALNGRRLTLGAEQLVVVGLDDYAEEKYDLGIDESVRIPSSIDDLHVKAREADKNKIESRVMAAPGKDLRIIFQQFGEDGFPVRSWGGAPPDGKKMDAFLKITAKQDGKLLPVSIQYDKMIWSGLSWAAGEIKSTHIDQGKPVMIQCISTASEKLQLKMQVYSVEYGT